MIDCFYRVFGGYADYSDRVWYNCPECKLDDLNKGCKHYYPISLIVIDVRDKNDHRMREE
jgi:hypothetical protein